MSALGPQVNFEVDFPNGLGKLQLQSLEEVEVWEKTRDAYMREYGFDKPNDLALLGTILTQQLVMFRAQKAMNGMEPQLDASGVPTGQYVFNPPKATDISKHSKTIRESSAEIRAIEKTLGIDKSTRESGGTHTLASYLGDLKIAANQYGVHIAKRVKAYEQFVMDLSWKLRLLENGDDEDRAYHDLSEEKVLAWCRAEIGGLHQLDKDFAHERGRLWLGRL